MLLYDSHSREHAEYRTSMALLNCKKEVFLQLFLIATTLVFLVMKFFLKEKQKTNNFKLPPCPPKLPIIGNLHQLGSLPHQSLHNLAKKFGPIIYLKLGQASTVVISSSGLAMEALKENDLALTNRPQLYAAKHLFYNFSGIAFAPYGPSWRHKRKICILELLSAKRVQSYSFVREQEVRHLVQRIAESYPSTTNLSRILGLYANSVLCRIAFDKDFAEAGEYDRYGFQKLVDEHEELLGGFSIADFFPSMEFISKLSGMEFRLKHNFKDFDKVLNELIIEHQNPENRRNHKDLVDVLLELQQTADADVPLTMDSIKAILLDMFAAGTDTTHITLDWAMTELVINPKALEKAQAEVRSIVKQKRFVSENDLPHLHYMKAAIKETFRLHPPASLLVPRESTQKITIGGYDIPAKTRIFINSWAIGRDSKSWENPDIFEPRRFLNKTIDYKGQDFELIPFGAGRRICPGITFATAAIELALAQLLHSFDWGLPPGIQAKDLDMKEVYGITTRRKSPLIVVAKPCLRGILT